MITLLMSLSDTSSVVTINREQGDVNSFIVRTDRTSSEAPEELLTADLNVLF